MTPQYLYELADLADPDKLWRLSGFDQMKLPPEKRRQLHAGVALRRHAADIERLNALVGTGKSLLITPMRGGRQTMTVPTPPEHLRP